MDKTPKDDLALDTLLYDVCHPQCRQYEKGEFWRRKCDEGSDQARTIHSAGTRWSYKDG